MSTLKKVGAAAASTALALGTGFAAPTAAAGGTVLADASNCTQNNVTAATSQQTPWEISAAGALTDWAGEPLTGQGVKVAVVDTGIAAGKQLVVSGGAVLNGETKTGDAADDDGHGTMVASIIGAKSPGSDGEGGMIGIAPGVQLISMREAGCQATAGNTEDAMATAINEAVEKGADVINISQDGYDPDDTLRAAVMNAYQHGVIVVTSAGNQGDRDTTDNNNKDYGVNPPTYPASYQPYVLAVGAVDQYDSVPTFSEKGTSANPFVGVVAPGVAVEALLPNGKLVVDDGTSFAAPYVAAEAALIIEEYDWTHASDRVPARAYEVMKIIEATADGEGSYSLSAGWGEAQISYALTKVKVSSSATKEDKALVSGSAPGSFGPIYGLPVKMYGAGPNKDGSASSAGSAADRIVAKPYVAAVTDKTAQSQQRWAYIALIVGLMVAAVTLGGAAVARDTARRRRAAEY
ncbi:S8 family serine peptidase [Actinospica robiniae]|uniref:S8 family serine peptidase n=1 Tax=Actinospica robiniae TaxID=304901 RepID=UPI0004132790|nr:S8 family serine peptidase [Actinospica robiniae]